MALSDLSIFGSEKYGKRVIADSGSAWYEVDGKTCIAAYTPIGAESYAASRVNIVNPDTYPLDIERNANQVNLWSPITGWRGINGDTGLASSTLLASTFGSMVFKFHDIYNTSIMGANVDATHRLYVYIVPSASDIYIVGGGGVPAVVVIHNMSFVADGYFGFSYSEIICNGSSLPIPGDLAPTSDLPFAIGGYNNNGTIGAFSGYVGSVAFYAEKNMTGAQLAAVAAAAP